MDTNQTTLAPELPGDAPMKQLAPFSILEQQARKMIADAAAIALLPPTPANAKVARVMRLSIVPLRTSVEKRHDELMRPIRDQGQALHDGKNALLALLKPMEEKLLAIEKHAERETARLQEEKRQARTVELLPFVTDTGLYKLGEMPDEAYAELLTGAKAAHEAKLKREEDARLAAEAERARIAAQAVENERLRKEAAEKEAALAREREEAAAKLRTEQEAAEKDRKAAAAALAAEQDRARQEAISAQKAREEEQARFEAERKRERRELQAKADAEAKRIREEAAERERIASEKAKAEADKVRKEREEAQAAADKENARLAATAEAQRQEAARLAAEIAEKKAAEQKAEAARLAAEKKAAAAPYKEKLATLAGNVRALAVPSGELHDAITEQRDKLAAWIEKKADEL